MPRPLRSPIWGTTRKCENCGKEFEPKSVAHKFCSHECYYVHHRNEQNEHRKMIRGLAREALTRTVACKCCGKEFTTRNPRAVYCSAECRIAGARENSHKYWETYKQSLMTDAVCAMCGKTFKSTLGSRTRFCPECRIKPKKKVRVVKPKPDPDRLNRKIREAQEKHISYGMLQVLAAREAAKEARRQAEKENA